jgi:hypothetical protein
MSLPRHALRGLSRSSTCSPPGERGRSLRRLAVAGALVLIVGLFHGLDGAVVVALSLAVMEIDAHAPPRPNRR